MFKINYMKTLRYTFLCLFILIFANLAAAPRIISFSGYDWVVRSSYGQTPPGPNYFSNSDDTIWIDNSGYLNLTISNNQGRWLCSEVTCREKLGYGVYTITIQGHIDQLDPQTVFGFFTWDQQNPPYYSEMDIEFSKWGIPERDIGQFTLQPYTEERNTHIFPIELDGDLTTHRITWEPTQIKFESWHGGTPGTNLIAGWVRQGDGIPKPGKSTIHLNYWLFQGKPLQMADSQHITIREFSYEPLP
ncbi:MAG: glycoside hydrolase family 16 protein [Bacteroidetes bacterium]|nr:glycoside hydrolase family 16 protein [Bacteroidota bacterium]